MNKRDCPYWAPFGAVAGMFAIALTNTAAVAADISPSLKLAPGVVKAAEGYETPATTYIVANARTSTAATPSTTPRSPAN
jgi:uncharacterized transporter YbjL